ncbi:MAG: hypothetical protein QXX08_10625, partial [Candidatus Bathyarchaeia archaeon]
MKEPSINIITIGYIEENTLRNIQLKLGTVFNHLKVTIAGKIYTPQKAYNPQRHQYQTPELIKTLQKHITNKNTKHLAITNLDLYTE